MNILFVAASNDKKKIEGFFFEVHKLLYIRHFDEG